MIGVEADEYDLKWRASLCGAEGENLFASADSPCESDVLFLFRVTTGEDRSSSCPSSSYCQMPISISPMFWPVASWY